MRSIQIMCVKMCYSQLRNELDMHLNWVGRVRTHTHRHTVTQPTRLFCVLKLYFENMVISRQTNKNIFNAIALSALWLLGGYGLCFILLVFFLVNKSDWILYRFVRKFITNFVFRKYIQNLGSNVAI